MAADEYQPCILVVDADADVAAGLAGELEYSSGRGYTFLTTLSAQSGLSILERLGAHRQPVALIIAGLELPDMPGPEFLSLARRLHPQAKRVALAAGTVCPASGCALNTSGRGSGSVQ